MSFMDVAENLTVIATTGKAVIKDKNKLSEAMEKLARYEDAEEKDRLGQWIPVSERLPKKPEIDGDSDG